MAKIYERISEFRRNYLIFPKYALLLSVLISSHILARKTVILILYITDTRLDIGLRGATLIVSVQEGVTGLMTLVLGHIAIAYSGPFKMILLSTLAYFVGIVLLWRDLSFYVAVFLIVVGRAGVEPLLKEFLDAQLRNRDENPNSNSNPTEEKQQKQRVEEDRTEFWWGFWYFLGSGGATFGMANINKWTITLKITAILIGVGLVIFFSGFKLYKHKTPTGSPLTTTIHRVFKAAISKRHLPYPPGTNDVQLSSHSGCLRWLDKATIPTPQEQERNGELCTVTDVNKVKLLLRTVPMSATFIVYRLISMAGDTFFIQQVADWDYNFVNNFRVSPAFFLLIQSISSHTISFLYSLVVKRWPKVKQTPTRIGLGVLCAFLCCITAWSVEVRRLNLVKKKLETGEDISMEVFWLIPQFCFLGFMNGLVEEVLIDFFDDHLGGYIMRYGPFLSEFVLGISTFPNMFWILTGWIGLTIDESNVDRCYLVLAILVIPNGFFYWYVSTYVFKSVGSGEDDEKNMEPVQGNVSGCQVENMEPDLENVPSTTAGREYGTES